MITVSAELGEERTHILPTHTQYRVESGERVSVGQQLTVGSLDPEEVLRLLGREALARYLVGAVQDVYRAQGVAKDEKHLEIVVGRLLRCVEVETPGDSHLVPGQVIDRLQLDDINRNLLAQGGDPVMTHQIVLGLTKASLNADSFMAAAAFQETSRVVTDAAIAGRTDPLLGMKENIMIGGLIPAGTGYEARLAARRRPRMSVPAA